MQGTRVQSLVGELRSHMPQGNLKKKKKACSKALYYASFSNNGGFQVCFFHHDPSFAVTFSLGVKGIS